MAGQEKGSPPRTPLRPEERQLPTTAGCEGLHSRAVQRQNHVFVRWAAERAEGARAQARAGATAAAGEQAPNGLSGASVIPSLTSSPTASVIQVMSFVPGGTIMQGHDGRALGMLKDAMRQPDVPCVPYHRAPGLCCGSCQDRHYQMCNTSSLLRHARH